MWVLCFLFTLIRVRFLSVAYFAVVNLVRCGLCLLGSVSQTPIVSQISLFVLAYRWSHNLPNYRRTITSNWYVPKEARSQVHATTTGIKFVNLKLGTFQFNIYIEHLQRTVKKKKKYKKRNFSKITDLQPPFWLRMDFNLEIFLIRSLLLKKPVCILSTF